MNGKRQVQVGETVTAPLPPTEVCHRLRVAYEVRSLRIGEDTVEILAEDGTAARFRPTHAEAGVSRDAEGRLWIEPVPDTLFQVFRHGEPVSQRMTSQDGTHRWLLGHVSYSADHAIQFEGYSVRTVSTKAERAELARLTPIVESLLAAWTAAEEVDAELGAEVQRTGEQLAALLTTLAGRAYLPGQTRATLTNTARSLHAAVDAYDELPEHDTGACADIADRLADAVTLAGHAVQA